jgi:hypothetical protein
MAPVVQRKSSMANNESLIAMQSRFGDRFEGMRLTYCERLHWPVWRHLLAYKTYESAAIDPLEEGFLLLVKAGLSRITDIARLLGCSVRYASEMALRLATEGGTHGCIALSGGDAVTSLPGIMAVLENRQRKIPVQKSIYLLRDAVFGKWLSYGTTTFEVTSAPNPEDGQFRWLGPVATQVLNDRDTVDFAVSNTISQISEPEIIATAFEHTGMLEWVNLWLGCYQPDSGARGRFLLFNPGMEDAPLPKLTSDFERDLGEQRVRLYFKGSPYPSAELFWEALTERITNERKWEEVELNKRHLSDAQKREAEIIREHSAKDSQSTEEVEAQNEDELTRLLQEVQNLQTANAVLEKQLLEAPRSECLEASQHPPVLRDAIRNSRSLLILICPWIRTRVLRPLLPDLDAAIRRGVQVLIGYGMPRNPNHLDSSDEEALAELRKRQIDKRLWLVHLNTHEKVIIQDDSLFVNSSFNFLSYTGGDGRRESGTLQRVGVLEIRDRFLNAFPPHVRQHVQEALNANASANQSTVQG